MGSKAASSSRAGIDMENESEDLERRLKAMEDEDGVSRYITDDDDIWTIAYDLLDALKTAEAPDEGAVKELKEFR